MISPELALLRECQDRVLEREGIPMVLALVSEVGSVPIAAEAAIVADGRRLAERMDRIGQAVAPTGRDSDMGRVVAVMQAAAYDDFGRELRM